MADHPAGDIRQQLAPGYQHIRVDLDGIDDFVAALRAEIDGNLRPNIQRLADVYQTGACFGVMSYSPDVRAARQYYHACLSRIIELLDSYVTAGEVLATAAEQVARQYRDTDAMVAAKAQQVSDSIGDAAAARIARDGAPPAGAQFGKWSER